MVEMVFGRYYLIILLLIGIRCLSAAWANQEHNNVSVKLRSLKILSHVRLDGFDPNLFPIDFSNTLTSHLNEWFQKYLPVNRTQTSFLTSNHFHNISMDKNGWFEFNTTSHGDPYNLSAFSSSSILSTAVFNDTTAWFHDVDDINMTKYQSSTTHERDILNSSLYHVFKNPALNNFINHLRMHPTLSSIFFIEIFIEGNNVVGGRVPPLITNQMPRNNDTSNNHNNGDFPLPHSDDPAHGNQKTSDSHPSPQQGSSSWINDVSSVNTSYNHQSKNISNPSALTRHDPQQPERHNIWTSLVWGFIPLVVMVLVILLVQHHRRRKRSIAFMVSSSHLDDGDQHIIHDPTIVPGGTPKRASMTKIHPMECIQEIVFDDFVGLGHETIMYYQDQKSTSVVVSNSQKQYSNDLWQVQQHVASSSGGTTSSIMLVNDEVNEKCRISTTCCLKKDDNKIVLMEETKDII